LAVLAAIIFSADAGYLPPFVERFHELPFGDKVLHFLMFGGLALVANLALASRGRRSLARAIVIGCILVLIVATAEEYSNKFVPCRDWSLGDLTANYLGVVCLGSLPLWPKRRSSCQLSAEPNDSPARHDTAGC
jgi:VanZ family protein